MLRKLKRQLLGITYPTLDWLDQADHSKHTPDLWRLEQYELQLLFVCDEMQPSHTKNTKLQGGIELGTAYTEDNFQMYKKRLGKESFPIPMEQNGDTSKDTIFTGLPKTTIKGELFAIRPEQFISLDKYKENRLNFLRKRVSLYIPYREVSWNKEQGVVTSEEIVKSPVKAWMYVGNPEFWNGQWDNGYLFLPVRTFSHKHPVKHLRYYSYTKLEYTD